MKLDVTFSAIHLMSAAFGLDEVIIARMTFAAFFRCEGLDIFGVCRRILFFSN